MSTLCEAVKIISLVQDQGRPGDSVTSPLRNGTALFFTLYKRGSFPKGTCQKALQINHILFGVNGKSGRSLLEAVPQCDLNDVYRVSRLMTLNDFFKMRT